MDNQSKPSISVLVAVYNGAKTLQQCIDSFSSQTCLEKELIVIDGGSTDGTVEVCAANSENIAYWVSESDRGVFSAWNKGLKKARGEWICFLGADDYFLEPTALEQMASRLKYVPLDIRLAYAQILLVNSDGEALFPVGEPWKEFQHRFMKGLCLPHQGVMHRRSLFEFHGPFDESFRIAGDYELMLRELKSGEAEYIPGIVVTAMRQGGLSSNPGSALATMLEIWRAQRMHGQKIPSLFWGLALLRVYMRLVIFRCCGDSRARVLFDLYRKFKGLPAYWTKT